MNNNMRFADLTTIGVGGTIARFIEPTSRVGVIEAVEDADSRGLPLCVLGGGSNLLVGDQPFEGVVVRDARRAITVPDEAAPVENGERVAHINAEAGCNWDDLVAFCVDLGLAGVEGLSGIPGTVGASVVQNIGAYGQEVGSCVESVEVWDRERKVTRHLSAKEMNFGYRSSELKNSMYQRPGVPSLDFFPTPQYVVLSVTFLLTHSATARVEHGQLAAALGVQLHEFMRIRDIRNAVLSVRAAKGMLEDAQRYSLPAMHGTKRLENIELALFAQNSAVARNLGGSNAQDSGVGKSVNERKLNVDIRNRHSCGSFFMNPQLTVEQAKQLPQEAPRFAVTLDNGDEGVKTSAAWLIDHAGFHKGFFAQEYPTAGLSSQHTLALINRDNATSDDIVSLATIIRSGVERTFGITLVPEPVCIGIDFDKGQQL